MRRDQLEHLIRAAGDIVQSDDVVVVGSRAILGSYDEAVLPGDATFSVEADIVPLGDVDGRRADVIEGAFGEASVFDLGIVRGDDAATEADRGGDDERIGHLAAGVNVGQEMSGDVCHSCACCGDLCEAACEHCVDCVIGDLPG